MSVFVVAELGVNWRNLNEADEMIRMCAVAGADAVKFQAYEQFNNDPLGLNKIKLDESAIRYLYWRCCQNKVEFMCTPMYLEAVDMLNPYIVRWKIRHCDRDNEELISKCRETGKPLFISGKNVYCDPSYPPSESPDFPLFDYEGYSCHMPFWDNINLMRISNLKYLEVHVKKDSYPDGYCPIDNNVSITMSELKQICEALK